MATARPTLVVSQATHRRYRWGKRAHGRYGRYGPGYLNAPGQDTSSMTWDGERMRAVTLAAWIFQTPTEMYSVCSSAATRLHGYKTYCRDVLSLLQCTIFIRAWQWSLGKSGIAQGDRWWKQLRQFGSRAPYCARAAPRGLHVAASKHPAAGAGVLNDDDETESNKSSGYSTLSEAAVGVPLWA